MHPFDFNYLCIILFFDISVPSLENNGASKPSNLAGIIGTCRPRYYSFLGHHKSSLFPLQPMLQELGKQNPHLMELIQEHQADFLRLINEPGGEE